MKKFMALSFVLALCTALFSFSVKRGGDIVEIYLNGKQVLQQFVHIDKSVKTLSFASFNPNDKIDVLYSHCGHAGTARVITIRNEKNEVVKTLSFANSTNNRSFMSFYAKELGGGKGIKLSLYYSSKELPEGRLLATLAPGETKAVAKR